MAKQPTLKTEDIIAALQESDDMKELIRSIAREEVEEFRSELIENFTDVDGKPLFGARQQKLKPQPKKGGKKTTPRKSAAKEDEREEDETASGDIEL
jgi:hypothetical protein